MIRTAIFESWLLGDGTYPPLHVGQEVNLSFELKPREAAEASPSEPLFLREEGAAQYEFCAEVVWKQDEDEAIAVVSAGNCSFFVEGLSAQTLHVGMRVRGVGTVLVDYYIWVENVDGYPGAPDLFRSFHVISIQLATIPERFIRRGKTTVSAPSWVDPHQVQLTQIEQMTEDSIGSFFILELSEIETQVARTFIA